MATTTNGQRADYVNWSKREPKKAAKKVWEMAKRFENSYSWRHMMAMRGALAYNGAIRGPGLFEGLEFDHPMTHSAGLKRMSANKRWSGFADSTSEQHAKAICETVSEKLFGMEEPKLQLVATDAEYEIRRQGVWADRFVEGTMHLSSGSYSNFWDMARQGALLAYCSTGTVAIRTEPDFVSKRVRSRLRSTLNTFIDPADVGCDKPLSYFDITWENPEWMAEDPRYKGKEDLIWKSATIPRHLQQNNGGATFNTPMVKVITAWRLPFGSFKGREAVFLGSSDAGPSDGFLWWEDWENPEPALSFLRCNRSISDDFWGDNMIEIALDPLADAEDVNDKARTTMKRTAQTYINLDGKSKVPDALARAKDVVIAKYNSKQNEKPVEIIKPGILNGDYFDYQARKLKIAHDLVGVAMMHQSGEVQGSSGQRSGRSIRLEASLLPERFARKLRLWRDWVAVECGKNHIRAAKQVGTVEKDWQVRWPGVDFEARVSVEVLDIDLEAYTIQAYAVSEQKNTPADRADAAQEMYDRSEISAEQLDVILEGLFDTKRETKASVAERAYVSKVADEMLYGPPELVGDENAYMAEEYIPPMPWMDADAMLAQAAPIFTQALIDRVPQNRRFLLRRFMEDIWALRQSQMREVAMANASVSVATKSSDPFAGIGAPTVPQLPGDPNAALAVPPPPPGTPGLGGPTPASMLGAPAAAPAPVGGPALNAPGAPGLV